MKKKFSKAKLSIHQGLFVLKAFKKFWIELLNNKKFGDYRSKCLLVQALVCPSWNKRPARRWRKMCCFSTFRKTLSAGTRTVHRRIHTREFTPGPAHLALFIRTESWFVRILIYKGKCRAFSRTKEFKWLWLK